MHSWRLKLVRAAAIGDSTNNSRLTHWICRCIDITHRVYEVRQKVLACILVAPPPDGVAWNVDFLAPLWNSFPPRPAAAAAAAAAVAAAAVAAAAVAAAVAAATVADAAVAAAVAAAAVAAAVAAVVTVIAAAAAAAVVTVNAAAAAAAVVATAVAPAVAACCRGCCLCCCFCARRVILLQWLVCCALRCLDSLVMLAALTREMLGTCPHCSAS